MIQNDLATNFVNEFLKKPKEIGKRTSTYGTVVLEGGKKRVRMDGSTISTPAVEGTPASPGDRVTVSLVSHTLTITGNLTKGGDQNDQ